MRRILDYFFNGTDNTWYKRIVKGMWLLTLAGILGIIFLFIGLSFTDLPSVEQLENPESEEASQVFAINGEVLGRYYTENRVPVKFEDLSPNLVNALLATEDERFYDHCGIDFQALGRVAVKTVILGDRSSGGASTITQQLAKQLFTGVAARNIVDRAFQKLKEWIIAVRLERKYTKQEIMTMYLNKFSFINGAYGIKAASEIYFAKSPKDLEMNEAAMLVGMLKNPSLFNPLRWQDTVLHRRMVVLKQMVKNGMLDEVAYDTLKNKPLGLNYQKQTHVDGLAPYFRMELAKDVKKILRNDAKKKPDGKPYNIYKDGLKIYTTLDPLIQAHAEESVREVMPKRQKILNRTWRDRDPWKYRSPTSQSEVPVEIRQMALTRIMRESERYQALRQTYLGSILGKLRKEFPKFNFHDDDREIDRMVQEYDKKGVINKLVQKELISSKLAKAYRQVMKSDLFPEVIKKWEQLQDKVDKSFNTPTKMKVFAYNDKMEADTMMSPYDSIRYHRMFLQAGVMAVDPKSGHVKAWVGGINHKYFQYDHVRINRQVGSTFKPFVYATAIAQQGFSPCYEVLDVPITISPGDGNFFLGEPWTPKNSDGKYSGELLTLREGLKQSKNTVSAQLMKELDSPIPVIDLIHEMGIDKNEKYSNGRYRVPRTPSICLGATDLSVMEMTGAYTTFANNGTYIEPIFLLKIEDKDGKVIYSNESQAQRPALQPNANYVMVDMLKSSAGFVGPLKSEVGGKTGTTNDHVDGWFMGFTPELVVGTWVGGEDRWIRFLDLTYGQGSFMAKPIFRSLMKKIEEDEDIEFDTKSRFYRPPGDLGIVIDCELYKQNNNLDINKGFDEDFSEDLFGDEKVEGDETDQIDQ
jgi:penicillin-binding protein 1A